MKKLYVVNLTCNKGTASLVKFGWGLYLGGFHPFETRVNMVKKAQQSIQMVFCRYLTIDLLLRRLRELKGRVYMSAWSQAFQDIRMLDDTHIDR